MKVIDAWLNRITMYRLLLYYLIVLVVVAAVFSGFGWLPFSWAELTASAIFLVCVSLFANEIFSQIYRVPPNAESAYITALILTLIVPPAKNFNNLIFLTFAAVLANTSKYILAINKKHIFNPAAIAVLLTYWGFGGAATWWVGTNVMLPFTALGGWLVVKKIQREDMVLSFLAAALILTPFSRWSRTLTESPFIFFATIMLTEPLTAPPTKNLRIIYGLIVGALFPAQVHFGSVYTTPELALTLGNLYSYFVSYKEKLILILKEKIQLAPDIYDFVFEPVKNFAFIPGQYMEWTLGHEHSDTRGNRRYFTLAAAPSEVNLRLGVRFNQPPSSYKTALLNLAPGQTIIAGGRAGDFILPKNLNRKLAFIAGGIGITPFRSMIKYLTDTRQNRDIVLFYSNKHWEEIVYQDVFVDAATMINLKTIYTLTDKSQIPAGWYGEVGRIDAAMIKREVPDWKERLFYLSGPQGLVDGFKKTLSEMGLPRKQIKIDFFPGF